MKIEDIDAQGPQLTDNELQEVTGGECGPMRVTRVAPAPKKLFGFAGLILWGAKGGKKGGDSDPLPPPYHCDAPILE
jgi:bacteriocin-like protein